MKREEEIVTNPMLQVQITDDLKDIPEEEMISCFGRNYPNPKLLKSNLQIQSEAAARKKRDQLIRD